MLYTSIVLAYDGSLDGRRALREGAEIAQQFQAHVHLLAVVRQTASAAIGQSYDPRSLPSNEPEISQTILNEGVEILKGLGLDAQGHLVPGDPVEEIVKLADAVQADLVETLFTENRTATAPRAAVCLARASSIALSGSSGLSRVAAAFRRSCKTTSRLSARPEPSFKSSGFSV